MDKKINWTKLIPPMQTIAVFQPNPEKIRIWTDKLLHEYLYVSDELRDPHKINQLLQLYLASPNNLFYEFKNFSGILGFLNIIPGYKCEIMYKFWDRKLWGATFLRELRNLANAVMEEFQLVRMSSVTADRKMEKFAHLCGFKTECAQAYGFRWNSKFYSLRLLARTRKIRRGG